MAAPKGTYGQPMQKAQRLMQELTKKDSGINQLSSVSQSPNLPNGLGPMPVNVSSGRLLRISVFRADGIWTRRSDVAMIKVTVVAPGGGSGGAKNIASSGASSQGGGGGGAAIKILRGSEIPAQVIVSLGTPGTAGAATPTAGGDATSASFGSLCVASGGKGGAYTNGQITINGSATGAPGVGTVGDILLYGTPGHHGGTNYGGFGTGGNGGRGASEYGGGGSNGPRADNSAGAAQAGNAGQANTGGGASGAACRYNMTGDSAAGAKGGTAIVVVEEYGK